MEQEAKQWIKFADTLTPYGVSIRYPNELFLKERHAKEALKISKEILDWTTEVIKTNTKTDKQSI